jgi:hypothetical protein
MQGTRGQTAARRDRMANAMVPISAAGRRTKVSSPKARDELGCVGGAANTGAVLRSGVVSRLGKLGIGGV